MIGSLLLGIFSIIFCLIFCVVRAKQATVWSLILKTLASVCFILCGIYAVYEIGSNTINLLIIAGLIMGLIGDILLDLKIMYADDGDKYFVAGTTSFIVGHIFYFVGVLLYNNSVLADHLLWNILASVGVAVVLTLVIMLSSKKMGMDFGKMLWLVIIYSFILTFMTAFTVSIAIYVPMFWIFASGMIAFFLSDLVLSMQYFGGRTEKIWIYVNHFLYYAAQILIAFSILYLAV